MSPIKLSEISWHRLKVKTAFKHFYLYNTVCIYKTNTHRCTYSKALQYLFNPNHNMTGAIYLWHRNSSQCSAKISVPILCMGPFCEEFAFRCSLVWDSSRCSGFLPQCKDMQLRWSCDSKLPVGLSMNGCLSICSKEGQLGTGAGQKQHTKEKEKFSILSFASSQNLNWCNVSACPIAVHFKKTGHVISSLRYIGIEKVKKSPTDGDVEKKTLNTVSPHGLNQVLWCWSYWFWCDRSLSPPLGVCACACGCVKWWWSSWCLMIGPLEGIAGSGLDQWMTSALLKGSGQQPAFLHLYHFQQWASTQFCVLLWENLVSRVFWSGADTFV